MSVPETPYEKKEEVTTSEELSLEQRVGRLEIVIENAFNALAKSIHEVELRFSNERGQLERGIAQTMNMINLTILQNIVTIREVTKTLVEKGVLDSKELDTRIEASLKEALEMQAEAIKQAQEAAMSQLQEETAEAPQA